MGHKMIKILRLLLLRLNIEMATIEAIRKAPTQETMTQNCSSWVKSQVEHYCYIYNMYKFVTRGNLYHEGFDSIRVAGLIQEVKVMICF